jgi:hypothetical protein
MIWVWSGLCFSEEEVEEGEEISKATGYSYHTVVLDCAPIAFIDSTGIAVRMFIQAPYYVLVKL